MNNVGIGVKNIDALINLFTELGLKLEGVLVMLRFDKFSAGKVWVDE